MVKSEVQYRINLIDELNRLNVIDNKLSKKLKKNVVESGVARTTSETATAFMKEFN